MIRPTFSVVLIHIHIAVPCRTLTRNSQLSRMPMPASMTIPITTTRNPLTASYRSCPLYHTLLLAPQARLQTTSTVPMQINMAARVNQPHPHPHRRPLPQNRLMQAGQANYRGSKLIILGSLRERR
ncbi:hypothetical protein C356_01487 [Cryptococcus neoformans c45]|nr:hypothetical protein C356_01487 [Cryptococcus neoformans var. grubii c45]